VISAIAHTTVAQMTATKFGDRDENKIMLTVFEVKVSFLQS
jgi:hypothetical protein